MADKNKKPMFTKKKDPPFKPGKTVSETLKNIAETYYDYGYITPAIVNTLKKIKKKFKKVESDKDKQHVEEPNHFRDEKFEIWLKNKDYKKNKDYTIIRKGDTITKKKNKKGGSVKTSKYSKGGGVRKSKYSL
jgi:hypothetical protein